MIRVEVNSGEVAVAQTDVAVVVKDWTHEDGVLVVGFSVVRVAAFLELFLTSFDLVVLPGAVETARVPSWVGGPTEHLLGLRDVDGVLTTESLLDDLVDELQIGFGEVAFLTVCESHSKLVGDKSGGGDEQTSLNVLFRVRHPVVLLRVELCLEMLGVAGSDEIQNLVDDGQNRFAGDVESDSSGESSGDEDQVGLRNSGIFKQMGFHL